MRLKYICILDDKVFEIPVSKMKDGKMFKSELKNKTVIMMEIIYETKDRRPNQLTRIVFSKPTFDHEGIYDYGEKAESPETAVMIEYIFSSITSDEESPLPIPIAPVIPTQKEIEIYKSYLNEKYPNLLKNSPNAIEHSIAKSKQRHKEEIEMLKESHRNSSYR